MKKIYSMTDYEDYLVDAMAYLEDEAGDEIDEQKAYELAQQWCYDDWNDFYAPVLEKYFDQHYCVASGSIGRWNGTSYGGTVIENARDFDYLLEDCWYIDLYDNNGYLTVCGHHHDGDVLFTVRELNDHGIEWYREHGWYSNNVINYLELNINSHKPQIEWYL